MNKYRNGFSLAELLLCFVIIGIVSAMGMTLTKHNVERVYRSYWQTGYNNLLTVIREIPGDPGPDPDNNPDPDTFGVINVANVIRKCEDMFNDINTVNPSYAISDPNDESYDPDNPLYNRFIENEIRANQNGTVNARNGISYTITDVLGGNQIHIVMTVPQQKTRQNPNSNASTELLYDVRRDILIPLPAALMNNNANRDLSNSQLLQFYIDNGQASRRDMTGASVDNTQLQPRTFANGFCNSRQYQNNGNGLDPNAIFILRNETFRLLDNDLGCAAAGWTHNMNGILVPVTK